MVKQRRSNVVVNSITATSLSTFVGLIVVDVEVWGSGFFDGNLVDVRTVVVVSTVDSNFGVVVETVPVIFSSHLIWLERKIRKHPAKEK